MATQDPIKTILAGGPVEVRRPGPKRPTRLRNYFLTGHVVAGPLAITGYLTWWFIALVDAWVKPLIPGRYNPETYLPFSIPGFGLVLAFVGLTLLGFLTANLVGRSLIEAGEVLLARMPVVRGLYKGVKQIFETVFKQEAGSFQRVGLIEWPGEGLWSLCFITEPAQGALAAALPGPDYLCVFVPCTPNPTTGYLVMMHRARVREINLTTDDAFKLLISMGIIQPGERVMPVAAGPLAAPEMVSAAASAREAAALERVSPH